MYRKREREFQYPPGIEKIIEDVIGGGTIDRRDLRNALFNGKSLDELPPIVIVVKDPETGLYHVLKTAMASDAGNETTYKRPRLKLSIPILCGYAFLYLWLYL